MIDLVYKTLLTILNKENQGYVTPTQFNLLANNIQYEIFRGYFEDENRDKNRENRGLTNNGYSNLSFNDRQRVTQFAAIDTITAVSNGTAAVGTLPADLYFIEESGLTRTSTGKLITEVERNQIATLLNTEVAPTVTYPVYEDYGTSIHVYPLAVTDITVRYLRKPAEPKWTYTSVASGDPLFNPSANDFQDFELHNSEFSNIVLKMLSYFGLNIREQEVIQIAEILKDKTFNKENS